MHSISTGYEPRSLTYAVAAHQNVMMGFHTLYSNSLSAERLQPAPTKYFISRVPGRHDGQACNINSVHLRELGKSIQTERLWKFSCPHTQIPNVGVYRETTERKPFHVRSWTEKRQRHPRKLYQTKPS